MRVVAISKDSARDSRAFADRYGIWFPLIADEDLEISKRWVGVNTEGFAIPGVFIVKGDQQIVFRQIGERKDDRVYASELVDVIDRELGTDATSRVAVKGGFGPGDKMQLRFGLGGGVNRAAGDTGAAGHLSLDLVYPLGSSVLVGPHVSAVLADSSVLDAGAVVKLRKRLYADLIEAYVAVPVGLSIGLEDTAGQDRLGFHAGLDLGTQFAVWPSLAPTFELGFDVDQFSTDGDTLRVYRFSLSVGAAWML